MIKGLVVFINSLMLMVFIVGCPSSEPERMETVETSARKSEPIGTETNTVDSGDIIISNSKFRQLGQENVESIELELDNAGPVIAGKNEPENIKIRMGEIRPAEPESVEVEQSDTEPAEHATLFHDKCAELLKDFVDEQGMVDYTTLRRQRLRLKALLREFENLDPNEYRSWTIEDKIALWLNVYNIQLLKIITDNYPVQSSRILRLYPGWGPNSILHIKGIWTGYKFLVMDEEFTLSEIDRRFFRNEFDDPRIFFAAFKGSLSGPPLRNEPYYGHRLDNQLDEQVGRFLSSPLALQIDAQQQKVFLSSLFQVSSYGKEFVGKFAIEKKFKDFGPAERAVLNFITNYVSQDIVSFLETGNYSIKYMKYDWTINDGS